MIQIDQEFKELIPALTKEEYEQLEANILAEGVRDSLLVWNGVLIDGHNRYEIATKFLKCCKEAFLYAFIPVVNISMNVENPQMVLR